MKRAIQPEGNKHLEQCSKALTYYTGLLSSFLQDNSSQDNDLRVAIIYYCMGFTYALLARDSLPTTYELLEEAIQSYSTACSTIALYSYPEAWHDFLVITLIAIGDTSVMLAQQTPLLLEVNATQKEYNNRAYTAYQQALNYNSHQQLRSQIEMRLDLYYSSAEGRKE